MSCVHILIYVYEYMYYVAHIFPFPHPMPSALSVGSVAGSGISKGSWRFRAYMV